MKKMYKKKRNEMKKIDSGLQNLNIEYVQRPAAKQPVCDNLSSLSKTTKNKKQKNQIELE